MLPVIPPHPQGMNIKNDTAFQRLTPAAKPRSNDQLLHQFIPQVLSWDLDL
jgi:hypothetical protein